MAVFNRVNAFRDLIKRQVGCDSAHLETVQLRVMLLGQFWEGDVEVFQLHNCPRAEQAFGFSYVLEGKPPRILLYLRHPEIMDTPELALRAAIGMGK